MAQVVRQVDEDTTGASDAEALQALDYTSRHYLGIPAEQFIERYDSGTISTKDVEEKPEISCVLDMLAFLRA